MVHGRRHDARAPAGHVWPVYPPSPSACGERPSSPSRLLPMRLSVPPTIIPFVHNIAGVFVPRRHETEFYIIIFVNVPSTEFWNTSVIRLQSVKIFLFYFFVFSLVKKSSFHRGGGFIIFFLFLFLLQQST